MKPWIFVLTFLMLCVTGYATAAAPISTQPVPRTKQFPWMSLSTWYQKHSDDVRVAEQSRARVIFLGDSITDMWDHAQSVWDREFAPFQAANFGIGGDLTQNLLWRLDHGAIDKLNPDVVVILIGVNNFLHNDASARDTFAGVQAVVDRALQGYPNAHIVLHGIFPYGEKAGTPERERVEATNKLIKTLADNPRVDYYDFGPVFLQDDGRISKSIMADYLHPTERGYELWAEQLSPVLSRLLKK
ncbi:GDSL-type esterase/lipase family protein [Microbulbifer rhizosphaerae]|uniref:Lysophospholipase L1-like esterase n=1 Tax=Microbulbifer rhizosphaerae TaxID=1562603 RepID=A0A7W4ZBG5_9GAMM|nr:GDSL-type esterase/lipase family protein [Microbulbifer rhizosphaerae]MBB3062275.1 lysophospholipase L1-like esterase [Microbulbifer rhizosphaerae]